MSEKIPNVFHFVFGLKPDFGGKPFSLVHYLSIQSAIAVNQPGRVYFHYHYEPTGYLEIAALCVWHPRQLGKKSQQINLNYIL